MSDYNKEEGNKHYVCYEQTSMRTKYIGPRCVRFEFSDGTVVDVDPLDVYENALEHTTLNKEYVCFRCGKRHRVTNHDEPYAGKYCELCYDFLLEEEEIDD